MAHAGAQAHDLVVAGRVSVADALFDEQGVVVYAMGQVEGSHGERYTVTLTPTSVKCDCEYGKFRETSHSHDQALRLQAQQIQRDKEQR